MRLCHKSHGVERLPWPNIIWPCMHRTPAHPARSYICLTVPPSHPPWPYVPNKRGYSTTHPSPPLNLERGGTVRHRGVEAVPTGFGPRHTSCRRDPASRVRHTRRTICHIYSTHVPRVTHPTIPYVSPPEGSEVGREVRHCGTSATPLWCIHASTSACPSNPSTTPPCTPTAPLRVHFGPRVTTSQHPRTAHALSIPPH